MSEKIYAVPAAWKKKAWVDDASYKKMYADSIANPEKFWAKQAKRIDWFKAPKKIKNTSYAYKNVSIK
jgi:acetyl-CoA synthetase